MVSEHPIQEITKVSLSLLSLSLSEYSLEEEKQVHPFIFCKHISFDLIFPIHIICRYHHWLLKSPPKKSARTGGTPVRSHCLKGGSTYQHGICAPRFLKSPPQKSAHTGGTPACSHRLKGRSAYRHGISAPWFLKSPPQKSACTGGTPV